MNMHASPLVSGLVSPAGARCTAPPADRDAWPGSPRAADGQNDIPMKCFVIAERCCRRDSSDTQISHPPLTRFMFWTTSLT